MLLIMFIKLKTVWLRMILRINEFFDRSNSFKDYYLDSKNKAPATLTWIPYNPHMQPLPLNSTMAGHANVEYNAR